MIEVDTTPNTCEKVVGVDTTPNTFASASVSVSELAYDTDQCCDSGSHWDVGECQVCSVANELGEQDVTGCDTCDDMIYLLKASVTKVQPTHLSPAAIFTNGHSISIGALLDTGALQGSYMSTRVAKILETESGLQFDKCSTRVCTAFNNCEIADKMSTLALKFFVNNKIEH